MRVRLAACAICFLLLPPLLGAVWAQSPVPAAYSPLRSTTLLVYIDGSVTVNQTVTPPQNTTSVKIPLLSTQVGNVVAVDQSKSLLSYELSGQNVTIFNLGANWVGLSYDTSALTAKQGTLWTLTFNSPFNMTLMLPPQSTLLSLSGVPLSISTKNDRPTFVLNPGSWEISYGLAIAVSTASATTSTSAGSRGQGVAAIPVWTWGIVIAALAAAGAGVAVVARKKMRGAASSVGLRYGDAEMLTFIREKGGRAIEAEIRERFSLPRTTAWRQAKRLERLGYIRIKKIGTKNQVELLRQDFDQPTQL